MLSLSVVKIITDRVPNSESWTRELYGAFNLKPNVDIKKVMFCVTPTRAVVAKFKKEGYDLLVSHHPFRVDVPQLILHTALDCCEGGLNDMWAKQLGIKNPKHFDKNLGWYGEIEPITLSDLQNSIVKITNGGNDGLAYTNGEIITSVVVCSGLGGMVSRQALATGADCYVTGELVSPANKLGFKAVIETGHTKSEWIGVNLIKEILEPHGIQVDYAGFDVDMFGKEYYREW